MEYINSVFHKTFIYRSCSYTGSSFSKVDIYLILCIPKLLFCMLYIMNNINNKQEYWKNTKLYRVLKDDTVSL